MPRVPSTRRERPRRRSTPRSARRARRSPSTTASGGPPGPATLPGRRVIRLDEAVHAVDRDRQLVPCRAAEHRGDGAIAGKRRRSTSISSGTYSASQKRCSASASKVRITTGPRADPAQLRQPALGVGPLVDGDHRHRGVEAVVVERQRSAMASTAGAAAPGTLRAHRRRRLDRQPRSGPPARRSRRPRRRSAPSARRPAPRARAPRCADRCGAARVACRRRSRSRSRLRAPRDQSKRAPIGPEVRARGHASTPHAQLARSSLSDVVDELDVHRVGAAAGECPHTPGITRSSRWTCGSPRTPRPRAGSTGPSRPADDRLGLDRLQGLDLVAVEARGVADVPVCHVHSIVSRLLGSRRSRKKPSQNPTRKSSR